MGVERFRSVADMNAAPVKTRQEREDAAFDRFLRHCARYWLVAPRRYPRGVFKFRTIEDAQVARIQAAVLSR